MRDITASFVLPFLLVIQCLAVEVCGGEAAEVQHPTAPGKTWRGDAGPGLRGAQEARESQETQESQATEETRRTEETRGTGENQSTGIAKELRLPWKLGTDYRYVWIRGGRKVGETVFNVRESLQGEKKVYRIFAKRSYSDERTTLQSEETTTLLANGAPFQFEEWVELRTIRGLGGRQEATLTFSEAGSGLLKVDMKYVHNGKKESPTVRETEVPSGAFLFASQAVEHWAVFSTTIPAGTKSHDMKLFYPEFLKTLEVTFQSKGTEEIMLRTEKVRAARYAFRSSLGELVGEVWIDEAGRLVQIEFPSATSKAEALRVQLAVR